MDSRLRTLDSLVVILGVIYPISRAGTWTLGSYQVASIVSVIGSSLGNSFLNSSELGISLKYFLINILASSTSMSPATTKVALFGLWYNWLNFIKSSIFAASRSLSNPIVNLPYGCFL